MIQNTLTSGEFAISFISDNNLDTGKFKCHTCDWELPCEEIITSRLSMDILKAAFEEEAQNHIRLHCAKKHMEEIQAIEKELK